MRLFALAILLALCGACDRADEPAPSADAELTELEAEGEARAEAVASRMVGQPAPAVTLTTIEGARIDLGELYGKRPVYLKFWATWCVPCREQMPEFERIYEAYGDRMEVIAVNTGYADDEAAVRRFLGEVKLKMPIAVDDGRLADLLDLRVTPQHVLIGRDGRIAYVGHLDGEPLEEALESVLVARESDVSAVDHPSPERADVLKIGDLVGDVSIETVGGDRVALGATDRPLGLLFFSPWCESYLAESRPAISEACRAAREKVEQRAADGGRAWLMVSDRLWATEGDLELYRQEMQTETQLALDATGEVFRRFGVRWIPAVALIEDGRLVRMLDGATLAADSDWSR